MTTTRISVAAAVAAALYACAVSAQNTGAADPATPTRVADAATTVADRGVSEVVVTATRREAAAQDIPLSITAISADSLEESGIEDVADLAHSMAGVNYTD